MGLHDKVHVVLDDNSRVVVVKPTLEAAKEVVSRMKNGSVLTQAVVPNMNGICEFANALLLRDASARVNVHLEKKEMSDV